MARRPTTPAKPKAAAPAARPATDEAKAPDVELVRAKSARPTYRRAGLVFNDRDWTVIDPEIGEAASLAILADPVLTVQVRTPEGWRTLTAADRAGAIAEAMADDAGE